MYEKVARWESKTGKHWVELFVDEGYAFYRANGAGGNLGRITEEGAIALLQQKVDSGYFLPDNAKTPMKRVI